MKFAVSHTLAGTLRNFLGPELEETLGLGTIVIGIDPDIDIKTV
jgi:hypothetical protein